MVKVYNNAQLYKELMEVEDVSKVFGGQGYIKEFNQKKNSKTKEDYCEITVKINVSMDFKTFFTNLRDMPVPLLIFAKVDTIQEIVERISYEKGETLLEGEEK